jgi:hypothetical protein
MSELNVDVGAAAETAKNVAKLFWAAGQIAAVVVAGAATLAALGAMSWYYPIVLAAMVLGAGVLVGLAVGLVVLAKAIVFLGSMIPNVKNVEKINAKLKALGEMVKSMSETIDLMVENILPITNPGWISDSPAKQLTKALPEFEDLIYSISDFLYHGLITPILVYFPDETTLKMVTPMVKGMAEIIEALVPILEFFSTTVKEWTKKSMWDGMSKADDVLTQGIPEFEKMFSALSEFLYHAIITPILTYFPDQALVDMVIPKISGMARILENLGPVLEFLEKVVGEWTDESWWSGTTIAEDLVKAMPEFEDMFYALGDFLYHGIITPVLTYFPDKGTIEAVVPKIEGMAKIIWALIPILDFLEDVVGEWGKDKEWFGSGTQADHLTAAMPEFEKMFLALGDFLYHGILTPVLTYFPDSSTIESVVPKIEGMAKILAALGPILTFLEESVSKYAKDVEWFGSGTYADELIQGLPEVEKLFYALGDFLYHGLITPVLTYFPDDATLEMAGEKIANMSSIISKLSPFLETLNETVTGLTEGDFLSDSPIEEIYGSTIKFAQFFEAIAWALRTGIIDPISNYFPDMTELEDALMKLDLLSMIMLGVVDSMGTLSEAAEKLKSGEFDLEGMQKMGEFMSVLNLGAFEPGKAREGASLEMGQKAGGRADMKSAYGVTPEELLKMQEAMKAGGKGKAGAAKGPKGKGGMAKSLGFTPETYMSDILTLGIFGPIGLGVKKLMVDKGSPLRKMAKSWTKDITKSNKEMSEGREIQKAQTHIRQSRTKLETHRERMLTDLYDKGLTKVSKRALKKSASSSRESRSNVRETSDISKKTISGFWTGFLGSVLFAKRKAKDAMSETERAEAAASKQKSKDFAAGKATTARFQQSDLEQFLKSEQAMKARDPSSKMMWEKTGDEIRPTMLHLQKVAEGMRSRDATIKASSQRFLERMGWDVVDLHKEIRDRQLDESTKQTEAIQSAEKTKTDTIASAVASGDAFAGVPLEALDLHKAGMVAPDAISPDQRAEYEMNYGKATTEHKSWDQTLKEVAPVHHAMKQEAINNFIAQQMAYTKAVEEAKLLQEKANEELSKTKETDKVYNETKLKAMEPYMERLRQTRDPAEIQKIRKEMREAVRPHEEGRMTELASEQQQRAALVRQQRGTRATGIPAAMRDRMQFPGQTVPVRGYATGGSFVTSGAELLYVGESGPERVEITPATGGVQPAQPAHLPDVENTMMRERAGDVSATLQAKELAGIEKSSDEQVTKLGEACGTLTEIAAAIKPKSGVVGAGEPPRPSTALDTLPPQSPQYGNWKVKPSQTPNTGMVNDQMS